MTRWQERPPAAWSEWLVTDPGASPAHHPAVMRALTLSGTGMIPRWLVVERDGREIGGMPVVVQRRGGFQWIHALPSLLPGAPLAATGCRDEVDRAAAGAIEALAAELGVVGGAWSLYRTDAPPFPEELLLGVGGETRHFEAAHVPLAGGAEVLLQRMDRKTRKEMRQARERGLTVAEDDEALIEAYVLYRKQAKAWRAHGGVPLELLRRLLWPDLEPPADGERAARLFAVRGARGLRAATLALDGPHETLLWWSGSHPDARGTHAFPLLLGSVMEWAHARGRTRVNLGASAGLDPLLAFKESLGAVPFVYPVHWLDARHARGAGRALGWLQQRLRRGRYRGEPA